MAGRRGSDTPPGAHVTGPRPPRGDIGNFFWDIRVRCQARAAVIRVKDIA